jgi:urease accessory protein
MPAETRPGAGRLEFEFVRGRTVLKTAFARSPLRFLTPENLGKAAWVYTTTLGGGLVDGDAIALGVGVGAGAEAILLSQSSTKVYRGRQGTSLSVDARVEPGGMLVSIPDPTVCFEGSSFAQSQSIDLADGASLLLMDTVHSGRHGSGERWAFDRLSSRIHVTRAGRPVFLEALALDPASGTLAERMGRFNALSVVVMIGPEWKAFGESIQAQVAAEPIGFGSGLLLTASRLGEDGTLIRMASVSTEDLARAARELLGFLPERLGDNPWSRKGA